MTSGQQTSGGGSSPLITVSSRFLFRLWRQFNSTAAVGLVLALGLAAIPLRSLGEAKRPVIVPAKSVETAELTSFIQKESKETNIVGISVGMMENGKVVFARGFGKSSLATGAPVTTNTMFGIGSVTKQFTSASILLLQEQGKLSINDKVSKYYPDLTSADEITVYDLMSMLSGYPDYYPLDFVDRRMARAIPPDKLIHEYATQKLDFPPETRWSYSNTGYIILGRIVEKVSGQTFGAFVTSHIFKPVGMTHTIFQPKLPGKGLALGYTTYAMGPQEHATPEAGGWAWTAGAIYSTPEDLLKWDLALMDGKVLKPESLEVMTTSRTLKDGQLTGYGTGQGVREVNGVKVLSHGGAVSGFIAQNTLIPSTRSAVVVLSNCESSAGIGAVDNKMISMLLPPRQETSEAQAPKRRTPTTAPEISGPSALDAARTIFHQLQTGRVDRGTLGEEFSYFLTPAKVRGASQRLKAYGEPTDIQILGTSERGGMEVAGIRFTFKSGVLGGVMYRTPDGKIQEFLIQKD